MRYLPVEWSGPTPLQIELTKPLKQISVECDSRGMPMRVTLWRTDGTGLQIWCQMHDIAERVEIGVLNFAYVQTVRKSEVIAEAWAFKDEIAVYKLVIHELGTSAESGIALVAPTGEEIVILPNAFPYNLTVKGVPSLGFAFTPENSLDNYERVPFHPLTHLR
jgi:hypothetical protein